MKVSHNNSRTQGSASHNDRTFDVDKADHIDQERLKDNRYWCVYEDLSFEEAERKFYEEHYGQMVKDQNQHRPEKLDIDDYLRVSRYCPEELILQIGNVDETIKDPAVFDACFDEYIKYLEEWNKDHGNHMHVLNWAVHKDEATIHAHIRRVWDYTTKDGRVRIGLDRALKEAGVQPPEPGLPEGRRNNRKMAFDRMMRARWIEICEERGITVDKKPKKARHLKIDDYKRDRHIEAIEHSRGNTRMVGELVREALGEIPEEKKTVAKDGRGYVSLAAEEYEALRLAAAQMGLDKEETARKEREAAEARLRAEEMKAHADRAQEGNLGLQAEIGRLKGQIAEGGPSLLADVMREGMQAVREPDERELGVLGEAGQAYDISRYASVYEAMDSLEDAYLGRERRHEEEER